MVEVRERPFSRGPPEYQHWEWVYVRFPRYGGTDRFWKLGG